MGPTFHGNLSGGADDVEDAGADAGVDDVCAAGVDAAAGVCEGSGWVAGADVCAPAMSATDIAAPARERRMTLAFVCIDTNPPEEVCEPLEVRQFRRKGTRPLKPAKGLLEKPGDVRLRFGLPPVGWQSDGSYRCRVSGNAS